MLRVTVRRDVIVKFEEQRTLRCVTGLLNSHHHHRRRRLRLERSSSSLCLQHRPSFVTYDQGSGGGEREEINACVLTNNYSALSPKAHAAALRAYIRQGRDTTAAAAADQ